MERLGARVQAARVWNPWKEVHRAAATRNWLGERDKTVPGEEDRVREGELGKKDLRPIPPHKDRGTGSRGRSLESCRARIELGK